MGPALVWVWVIVKTDGSFAALILRLSLVRMCTENTPEFWARWRDELADIGREMAAARPDHLGLFLVNCPFHGVVSHAYSRMGVATLDGAGEGDTILVRDLLYNFVKETHPFQAIDDMSVKNTNCTQF